MAGFGEDARENVNGTGGADADSMFGAHACGPGDAEVSCRAKVSVIGAGHSAVLAYVYISAECMRLEQYTVRDIRDLRGLCEQRSTHRRRAIHSFSLPLRTSVAA